MNTQIIAIANQKGGVGKTTTCANLGIGLAQAGKKVLLIDGDPQGSLTISLGHPQPDKLPFTLSDVMGRILMDEALRPGEGILHHPEGVDLMPADIQLSGMEVSLVNAMSRETILRQYCRQVYDAGYSPICPVLFLPTFLKDDIPQEHKDGLDMARDYLRRSHVLVVCGHGIDETVKNDIATAERLRITATTLDGILTVKGQGRGKGGARHA